MYIDSTYFTEVNKQIVKGDSVSYTGILVASKLNQKNGQDYPLIDFVDIDFNGAWISSMGNTYLRTAKDLVDVLDFLNSSNELNELTEQIKKIWNQINEITATYITYTSLDDILQTSWQRKLEAGSYIDIDTSNELSYTISVVGLPTYDFLDTTYTSLDKFNAFKQYISDFYYNKTDTNIVAYNAAYEAIQRVIDGADNAFDTLKEIADWILDQNRYTPVSWDVVLNEWKEEYYYIDKIGEDNQPTGKYEVVNEPPSIENTILEKVNNPEDILTDENWKENYYGYINSDGEWVLLAEKSEFDDIPEGTDIYFCHKQYYIEENYLTDIQNLIIRVNRLDDTVGFKEYNEKHNTYTYSGHCLDIYNLQKKDDEHDRQIGVLADDVFQLKLKTEETYTMAYDAYTMGYTAYNIAYTALEQSFASIEKAEQAYDMAYTAIVKVGNETKPAEYIQLSEENTEEEFITLKENGVTIYEKTSEGEYVEATGYDERITKYYYFSPEVEGTGLTKRVEDVEALSYEANTRSIVALESSYESLYHLMVNNDSSTYVNLSLEPTDYWGTRDRTLHITTKNASVDSKTGKIYSQGIVGVNTAFDIYTYASSWMMLYVDNDVNWEDLDAPVVNDGDTEEQEISEEGTE